MIRGIRFAKMYRRHKEWYKRYMTPKISNIHTHIYKYVPAQHYQQYPRVYKHPYDAGTYSDYPHHHTPVAYNYSPWHNAIAIKPNHPPCLRVIGTCIPIHSRMGPSTHVRDTKGVIGHRSWCRRWMLMDWHRSMIGWVPRLRIRDMPRIQNDPCDVLTNNKK